MPNKTNYQLPKLPYDLDALEPVISKEALQLHYEHHHQSYIAALNEALDKYHVAEEKKDFQEMARMKSAISFHGGGHINHSFFWASLAPVDSNAAVGEQLLKAMQEEFESLDNFKEKFKKKALALSGSGWVWLGYSKLEKKLKIVTTKDHETISALNLIPIFVVDLWEHAYYLQYQHNKEDFLDQIWKIFNWQHIEDRFVKAML